MVNVTGIASEYNPLKSIDINQLILNGVFALLIIIVGVFVGKLVSVGLRKLSQKLELNKRIRGTFIDLFLAVIKWSIYLLFISFGLNQLEIPKLTYFFTNALIIIPSLVGGLILLIIGLVIALYLKEVIKRSEIKSGNLISQIVFFFIIYLFGIYSIRIALISFDEWTTNMIIIVLTIVTAGAIAYVYAVKELKKS